MAKNHPEARFDLIWAADHSFVLKTDLNKRVPKEFAEFHGWHNPNVPKPKHPPGFRKGREGW